MKSDIYELAPALQNLGLTKSEAILYLTCMKAGRASVLELSLESGIKRSTVYSMLPSLVSKGLFETQVIGFKKKYIPCNPDRLLNLVDDYKTKIKNVLPKLSALYTIKGSEGLIKHFSGTMGIRGAYNSLLEDLEPGDFYLSTSEVDRWYSLDPSFFESIRSRRSHMGLNIRILVNDTKSAREYAKKTSVYKQQTKVLPAGIELTTTITLTPHRILFHQITGQPTALLLDNPSIIQVHKEMFELLWPLAKTVS